MRVRAAVSLAGPPVARDACHVGARPAVYAILASASPALSAEVHEHGWAKTGRRPWSICPPSKTLTYGLPGFVEIATPEGTLAGMLADGLAEMPTLRWGDTLLAVGEVSVVSTLSAPTVTWWATTPTVVRAPSADGRRCLLPGDDGWESSLRASIRSAAKYLDVPCPEIVAITGGGRRIAATDGGRTRAATAFVSVTVQGAPEVTAAVADLGIGSRATEGFGFVEPHIRNTNTDNQNPKEQRVND